MNGKIGRMESDMEKLHTLQVPKLVRSKAQTMDNSLSGLSDDSESGLGFQNTLVSIPFIYIFQHVTKIFNK